MRQSKEFKQWLKEYFPSADRPSVVRCKDCKHRQYHEGLNRYYCEMFYGQGDVSDENYCQWGEREEP